MLRLPLGLLLGLPLECKKKRIQGGLWTNNGGKSALITVFEGV